MPKQLFIVDDIYKSYNPNFDVPLEKKTTYKGKSPNGTDMYNFNFPLTMYRNNPEVPSKGILAVQMHAIADLWEAVGCGYEVVCDPSFFENRGSHKSAEIASIKSELKLLLVFQKLGPLHRYQILNDARDREQFLLDNGYNSNTSVSKLKRFLKCLGKFHNGDIYSTRKLKLPFGYENQEISQARRQAMAQRPQNASKASLNTTQAQGESHGQLMNIGCRSDVETSLKEQQYMPDSRSFYPQASVTYRSSNASTNSKFTVSNNRVAATQVPEDDNDKWALAKAMVTAFLKASPEGTKTYSLTEGTDRELNKYIKEIACENGLTNINKQSAPVDDGIGNDSESDKFFSGNNNHGDVYDNVESNVKYTTPSGPC